MAYLVAATGVGVNGVFQTPATGWPGIAGGMNLTNIPLRMYIVSGSKKDLFLNCGENQSTSPPQPSPSYGSNLVSDLQNWIKKADGPTDPSPGAIRVPDSIAQWGSAYAGGGNYHTRGEFLHVKAVDLRPLFCRVELEDFRSPPSISITNFGTNYVGSPIIQTTTNGFSLTLTADSSTKRLTSVSFGSAPEKLIWSNTSGPYTLNITNGGGTNGQVYISFPLIPSFSVGALTLTPLTLQEESFYVLKGTSLNLSGNSTVINQDSKFQYSYGTWRQLY
jgi:hypothetical protein